MSREVHAGICESRRVRFPPATRLPVAELVEPGGDRGTQALCGVGIDLAGHRHHQRLRLGMHHLAGVDAQHLLTSGTPSAQTKIGVATTAVVRPPHPSGPFARAGVIIRPRWPHRHTAPDEPQPAT